MGIRPMCWGVLFTSIFSLIINTHYTGKLINLGFIAQMRDLLPILALSLAMGGIVYITMNYISLNSWLLLAIGLLEGILVYVGLARLFHFNELSELVAIGRRK